ncbi:MAG TPA: DUF2161 family putative PD-(D/E)XK-type phosphodiesterase [Planctomycetota bacterium]|jgi:hypothetical protein
MIKRETELYEPLKEYFETQGFDLGAEVHGCDLVARRGDELVVAEMKRVFNLDLVLQGIQRQALTETVFLAVEEPRGRARRRWRGMLKLCRMLGLGLLTVRFRRGRNAAAHVDVWSEPAPYKPRLNVRKRTLLLRELDGRSANFNVGGCTRRPIVTAYREEALRLASHLGRGGPTRVKQLAQAAQSGKAQSILQKNFYGWFERIERGTYQLTPAGSNALEKYAEVVRALGA